jgi:hypothetical protein
VRGVLNLEVLLDQWIRQGSERRARRETAERTLTTKVTEGTETNRPRAMALCGETKGFINEGRSARIE